MRVVHSVRGIAIAIFLQRKFVDDNGEDDHDEGSKRLRSPIRNSWFITLQGINSSAKARGTRHAARNGTGKQGPIDTENIMTQQEAGKNGNEGNQGGNDSHHIAITRYSINDTEPIVEARSGKKDRQEIRAHLTKDSAVHTEMDRTKLTQCAQGQGHKDSAARRLRHS